MIDRENPILCYVTDRQSLSVRLEVAETALVEKITAIAAAGVDWVQVREKDLPARRLAALTREVLARTRSSGSNRAQRIIVNDRVDVAVTEGLDGVHLGESGLPVIDVAKWAKRNACGVVISDHGAASQFPFKGNGKFLIGASCHSLESAKAAARDGADYIFFGPVFATPLKAQFGEPQGVKRLAEVCVAVPVPVIAIGGIALKNAGECVAVGAAGIAAIRLFQDAGDPAETISALRESHH